MKPRPLGGVSSFRVIVTDVIIAVLGKKGGVSKSTTAMHLAQVIHEAGESVTLYDTDPEASAYKMRRMVEFPIMASSREKLTGDLKPGHAVIDSPPNDPAIIYKAASIADRVIVPISPTGYDLARLTDTLSIIKDVEDMRKLKLARVLLTRMQTREVISQEVREALDERGIPRFAAHIRLLTAYKGYSKPEYLDEYRQVWAELQ